MNLNDLKNSKQWGLVDGKAGRLPSKIKILGKWEQILKEDGNPLGISTVTNPRPDLWLTYDEAKEALSELQNDKHCPYSYSGIGLIVANQIAVIDLDHCIDEGVLNPLAKRVLEKFKDTYIEFSKSGKGLHFYMIYNGPYHFAGNQKKTDDGAIEIYTGNKVAVMTNKSYNQIEELKDYTQELDGLIREYYPEKTKTKSPKEKKTKTIFESIKKPLPEDSQAKEMVKNYMQWAAQAIQKAAPHDKNNTLFKKAALAGGYAWTGYIDFDTVKNQFKESLSKREGDETSDNEFDSTFASGWNTGIQSPSNITTFIHSGLEFICAYDGLHYSSKDKDGNWKPPKKLSDPIWVIGRTHDIDGFNCGKYLKWIDGAGKERFWAMPLTLTQGESTELFKVLIDAGVKVENESKLQKYFIKYLMYAPAATEYICTDSVGWMDKDTYVLPGKIISNKSDKKVLFQSENYFSEFKSSGSFDEWQKASKLVQNNSRFILAESMAFAAPLLGIMPNSFEGGGINFIGKSGGGKTTALQLASSVFGNPDPRSNDSFIGTWNTTANAIESVCFSRNHCLLCLDEMGQCDAKAIGKTVYTIGNGQSKNRMNKNISLRKRKTWKLLFLSTGEKNLAQIMNEYGTEKTKEGQLVRLADVPADAGFGMRMVEALNGCRDSNEFVRSIQDICIRNYGFAGELFIKKVLENKDKVFEKIEYYREHFPEWVGVENDSDACRVADRFALIAAAGELASDFGITGWPNQIALEGVKKCFKAWLTNHGGKDRNRLDFLKKFQLFISRNKARFEEKGLNYPVTRIPIDRVGSINYENVKDSDGVADISKYTIKNYYFNKNIFDDIFCSDSTKSTRNKDYEYSSELTKKEACTALLEQGWIEKTSDNKFTKNVGVDLGRCLIVLPNVLTDEI